MTRVPRGVAALAMVVLVVASISAAPAAASSGGPSLDYSIAPNPYVHEDVLTIAEHDRGAMDSVLSYYGDSGNVQTLSAAKLNQSQDEPVGVRMTAVDAAVLREFPRVDGESGNARTWVDASAWSESGLTATNTTVVGNDAVELATNGSMASGDVVSATYSDGVDITSDVSKRVLRLVLDIDSLDSATNITVRMVDGDGDYYYASIDTSADYLTDSVIANNSVNGVVFQERLADLPSSGTVDSIQKIEVVAQDGDFTGTITGLDVESKSTLTLGETVRDTDGDGNEDDTVTVEELPNGSDDGVLELTSLDSMGAWSDSATIYDLEVYNVRYPLASASTFTMNLTDAPGYGSYPKKLKVSAKIVVPSAIDLSHGTLELRLEQGHVAERYVRLGVATAVGDTNLSEISSWSDQLDQIGSTGDTLTLATGIVAGDKTAVRYTVLLTQQEAGNVMVAAGGGGPMAREPGGGFLGGLFSLPGLLASITGIGVIAWFRSRFGG